MSAAGGGGEKERDLVDGRSRTWEDEERVPMRTILRSTGPRTTDLFAASQNEGLAYTVAATSALETPVSPGRYRRKGQGVDYALEAREDVKPGTLDILPSPSYLICRRSPESQAIRETSKVCAAGFSSKDVNNVIKESGGRRAGHGVVVNGPPMETKTEKSGQTKAASRPLGAGLGTVFGAMTSSLEKNEKKMADFLMVPY